MFTDLTPNERLAVLESELRGLTSDLHASNNQILTVLKDLRTELAEQKAEMTKYKGFLGGCVFLLSCVWTAVVTFKDAIFHR